MKFKKRSELREKQIEIDVANYFGLISPSRNTIFRLIASDEQETGADLEYSGGVLIYLQFKVADALDPVTAGKPVRKGSKKDQIRHFRKSNQLSDDPSLYFQIRKKASRATDFQHNILLLHNKPPHSYAVYVAPLTLSKHEYGIELFSSASLWPMLDPFRFELRQEIWNRRGMEVIRMIPFLRGHISIAPHEIVKSSDHYYSFSTAGTEIAWHSPTIISEGASRLSDKIYEIVRTAYNDRESVRPLERLVSSLDLKDGILPESEKLNGENSNIRHLQEYGKLLYKEHEIVQYILLVRR